MTLRIQSVTQNKDGSWTVTVKQPGRVTRVFTADADTMLVHLMEMQAELEMVSGLKELGPGPCRITGPFPAYRGESPGRLATV